MASSSANKTAAAILAQEAHDNLTKMRNDLAELQAKAKAAEEEAIRKIEEETAKVAREAEERQARAARKERKRAEKAERKRKEQEEKEKKEKEAEEKAERARKSASAVRMSMDEPAVPRAGGSVADALALGAAEALRPEGVPPNYRLKVGSKVPCWSESGMMDPCDGCVENKSVCAWVFKAKMARSCTRCRQKKHQCRVNGVPRRAPRRVGIVARKMTKTESREESSEVQ